MSNKERLLKPSNIPTSLWDADAKALRLPSSLAAAYRKIIEDNNLLELANSRNPNDPPVGGLNQEQTDQHFAQAFDGSAARAQLAILDPKGDVKDSSNTYIKSLAGNSLILTDAPCGAGAASLSFLTNIAELRASSVLPREPLEVFFIGAELSEPARTYAQNVLAEIRPSLEQQAIFVDSEFMHWDVTDNLSNTDLIRKMTVQANGCENQLLVVANFNGFLEQQKKRKEAEPQLAELFRHASGEKSVVIWIEPKMNKAIANGGLFHWLRTKVQNAWRHFATEVTNSDEPITTSETKFYLPLKSGSTARVGLAVMPIDLVRTK